MNAPSFIASGDSLAVKVTDPDWSNDYTVQVGETDRAPVDRAPVFGQVGDLASRTKFFPLNEGRSGKSAAVTALEAVESDVDPLPNPPAAASAVEALLASPPARTAERAAWAVELEQAYSGVAAYRDQLADVVDSRTEGVNSALQDLHRHLAGSPDDVRMLQFLADTLAHRVLQEFASSPIAADLRALLIAAMQGRSPAPDTAVVDAAFERVGDYARRLNSVTALIPSVPDPTNAGPESDFGMALATLRAAVTLRDDAAAAYEPARLRAERAASVLRGLGRDVPPPRVPHVRMAPLFAAGVDLRALLASTEPDGELARLRESFFAIDENTRTVVEVSQQLPRWVVGPKERLVYGRIFRGSKTLSVTVTRHPRYSALAFKPRPPTAPAQGEAATADAHAAAPGAGTAATIADSEKPAVDPNQVAKFDVLLVERYRFHVGAGFIYSPISTRTYTTTPDTVDGIPGMRVTEESFARNRVFPAMVISYAILPTAGRILDGAADRNRLSLDRAGLSVQAGMSLQKPTEQLYFGLSAELFPGLSLGSGYSLAYLARARAGSFVPDTEGTPVRSRWLGKWRAFSLVLDANVFTATIGALLK